MNILLLLIPISLVLLGIGIATFLWAVRSGQFDDLESPGLLALLDDRTPQASARTSPLAPDEVEVGADVESVGPPDPQPKPSDGA